METLILFILIVLNSSLGILTYFFGINIMWIALPSIIYLLLDHHLAFHEVGKKIFFISEFFIWGIILPLIIGQKSGAIFFSVLNIMSILYTIVLFKQTYEKISNNGCGSKLFGVFPAPFSSGGVLLLMIILNFPMPLIALKMLGICVMHNTYVHKLIEKTLKIKLMAP